MKRICVRLVLAAFALACVTTPAFAQGGSSSSITGVVIDKDGGGVPGANVSAKNEATSEVANTVTNSQGNFTIPAVAVGTYTVTVTLQGFKTAVNKGVIATGGAPATVRVILEVGGITDTVVVLGATERIQTQASAASTTLNTKQIGSLPLSSRNTLDFVTFLPGVLTPGGSRDSIVNGLPQSSIAITLDGISIQDNALKTTDGFFARMSPRLDAVEEVTVTTAAQSADSAAQGSTQIKFTTRSGSNTYTGSVYEYYQSDKLNTNTFFNKINKLPKNTITQHQPGVRAGGPFVIPGVYDGHNKAFFFVNYEELHQPASRSDNRTILQRDAQNGIFRWSNGPAEGINLYTLAAANGQTSTPDPLVAALLTSIRNSTANTGTISALTGNLNAERFSFQQPVKNINTYPTLRGDYNISSKHRFTASFNKNHILSDPDTTNSVQASFPGFPVHAEQNSLRWTWSTNLRSNLGKNLVNDFHWGGSGGPTQFSPSLVPTMFSDAAANQNGFALGISAAGITNAYPSSTNSSRQASTRVLEDSVNWLHGAHSVAFGGGFTQVNQWLLNDVIVPGITFGLPDGDPALNMFTPANFPGSSSGDRNSAQALYAVLTGHISSVTGTAGLDAATGKYVYNGERRQDGRMNEMDFYIQDNWRVRPNLSLNLGLRYALQMPFIALNSSYSTVSMDDLWGYSGFKPNCDSEHINTADCNLFNPGARVGAVPTYQNLGKGVKAYNTDWDNYAPSLGANWTPGVGDGFMRRLLGPQGTSSFSGGWSRAYERHGMTDFTGVFGANPGLTQNADRTTLKLNLGPLPLLLRSGDLGAPAFCAGTNTTANSGCVPVAPEYPIASQLSSSVNRFDPNLQVPYADTFTVGYQRLIGKRSAIEARYIGTRNWQEWSARNINEVNITTNGFLDEFKLAQQNLQASVAAGCGGTGQPACTFAYRGPGTGTSPLPIYLAFFSGVPAAQAGDSTKYTSSNFTSTNWTDPLALWNSNPRTPAGTGTNTGLRGSQTRIANAIAAGLPANFFIANPDVSSANVTTNQSKTKYNSIQLQFRRRLSQGLQFDTNYVFGKAYETNFFSFLVDRVFLRNTGTEGDVTHGFKATWIYELPFGQGRRFGSGIGTMLDRLIGGWSITGTARIQSGSLVDLGNVRLVGMSKEEAGKAFKFRRDGDLFYAWPQDIIDNTIKAYQTSATTKTGYANDNVPTGRYFAPANTPDCLEKINGYGDCGVRSLIVTGPWQRTADMTFAKRVALAGRTNAEIRFDVLNIFQAVNFAPGAGISSTTLSGFQTTSTSAFAGSSRTTQIQLRFNW